MLLIPPTKKREKKCGPKRGVAFGEGFVSMETQKALFEQEEKSGLKGGVVFHEGGHA